MDIQIDQLPDLQQKLVVQYLQKTFSNGPLLNFEVPLPSLISILILLLFSPDSDVKLITGRTTLVILSLLNKPVSVSTELESLDNVIEGTDGAVKSKLIGSEGKDSLLSFIEALNMYDPSKACN